MKVENKSTTSLLNYYDVKDKIAYDIFNDDENIHVYIATRDYATQLKILKFGFTLWLDQEGKKNKDKGVIFPQPQHGKNNYPSEGGRMKRGSNSGPSEKMQQMMVHARKQFKASPKNMILIGMLDEDNRVSINTELDNCKINVSISFDTLNMLRYKAIIPIDKIFTDEKFNNGFLSIGFDSGFLEMSFSDASQGGRGGMSGGGKGGGGRGGMSGGGKGGGRRSGSNGNAEEFKSLMDPVKVWFKASLNTD